MHVVPAKRSASRDPYAAAVEWGTTASRNWQRWLWVPAFAGTTMSLVRSSRQPHHFQQHRLAGIDQLFQRDARGTLAPDCAAARQRRDVNEGREARAAIGIHGLDRAPAQIVAEIASGIARGA